MNNKILTAVLITGIVATWFAWLSSADYGDKDFKWFSSKHAFNMMELTDEQIAEREAKHAEREAKEAVIDALLAGQSLTAEQETLRTEIIAERAERKAKREEMKALKEEIKPILEKKRNGEDLTEAEQAKLDEFKENHPGKGFKKGKRGWKWGSRGMNR